MFSRPTLATAFLAVSRVGLRLDLHPLGECDLPAGHHGLARFQPLRNHDHAALPLPRRHRTLLQRAVLLDQENVRSRLRDLHGLIRHQGRVLERVQDQPHVDKRTGQ